ncbi:unnamed protein product [Pleuronectes platessa]|uniref:Voltage-dependent L-type calcium channel IQ-associated domain-containing protein n=1 Tax=Pleuronectes platessa TaxID=8262 RepID=A0A9N7UNS7_PLEPL|nr:unnamed protein product [Pleuronectes platessa]
MYDMLRHMCPPLGLGKRCPARVAYKVRKEPIYTRVSYGCQGGPFGGGARREREGPGTSKRSTCSRQNHETSLADHCEPQRDSRPNSLQAQEITPSPTIALFSPPPPADLGK